MGTEDFAEQFEYGGCDEEDKCRKTECGYQAFRGGQHHAGCDEQVNGACHGNEPIFTLPVVIRVFEPVRILVEDTEIFVEILVNLHRAR